ncbi:MAG: glycosyltransferase family 39 protein, partial [Acidobacteriota bacterium]
MTLITTTTSTPADRPDLARFELGLLAGATLVFFALTANGYGIFRDELYYLACAAHLDWGYVDHPPLIAWLTAPWLAIFGDSLLAIRMLPALAGVMTIVVAGCIARELGGGKIAQLLAAATTVMAPIYLSLFSFLSMNAIDVLIWALAWWLLARILRTGDMRLWLLFGLLAGIGLQNKISVLFLGFGLVVGLLIARRWEVFRSRWLWLGGVIAGVLFLPHVLWQIVHGWPTLEFMANARERKIADISAVNFILEQVLLAGPSVVWIWLGGLLFLLVAPPMRPFRTLGWAWLTVLVVLITNGAKPYYLGASFTLLFAAGAVAVCWLGDRIANWFQPGRWLLPGLAAVGIAAGVVLIPLAKASLPVEEFVAHQERLGIAPTNAETSSVGVLPQHFADMHGWSELADSVAEAWEKLSPAEQQEACIFGQNYGQAGAIDRFGPALGLPGAISTHNSYFMWGPGSCTAEVMIVIGDDRESLEELFEQV